jgi:uncharacterized repeat protein (TIGR03803 family)
MKTSFKLFCLVTALLAVTSAVKGQTLTALVNFSGGNGANPQATLVVAGNTLYGTTYAGGVSNAGTVFAYNLSNGAFSNVYTFTGTSDGRGPQSSLVAAGNILYGTAESGALGFGTVFAVNTNGSGFTNVYSFRGGADGSDPAAGLLLISNVLYGTTFLGGEAGEGAIFAVNTNGNGFSNLYSFTGGNDGANPEAPLIVSGNTLYGTASAGGSHSSGAVFRINVNGGSFSNIYSFTGGSDGANPEAGLVLAGTTLYGTANGGGDFEGFGDYGTVFSVNTNGGGFSSYLFNYTVGANPQAGLILLGGTLYGTAAGGGGPGYGTVFQINTNGSGFTNVYSFTDDGDGATPEAGLLFFGNTLYGTTQAANNYGYSGTVFALTSPSLTIPLNISLNGSQVTLSWSSSIFSLQSAPAVTGVYSNVPGATSPYTTAASGKVKFFRLRQN